MKALSIRLLAFGYLCLTFVFGLPVLHAGEEAATVSDQESFARQAEVPSNVRIVEINHYQGSLTVIGWDQPHIMIEGTKRARGETVEYARQIMKNIQIKAYERVPQRLVLEYDGPPIEWRVNRQDAGIDYTAHVPRQLALDIKLYIGSVTVQNMDAPVAVDHRAGDVTLEAIGGKAQVRAQGGVVRVRGINGPLKLDTKESKLIVSDIKGDLAIRHKVGDMGLRNIDGKVILNSLKSKIILDQIKGRLDIDHREGDIIATRFYDAVRVYLFKGDLRLSPGIALSQNYYCAVDNGDVILRVPEESSMMAEIEVERGRIVSDYYMPISSDRSVSYCKGAINGGRNVVQVSVKNGSASLLQGLPGVEEKFDFEIEPAAPPRQDASPAMSSPRTSGTNEEEIKPVQLP